MFYRDSLQARRDCGGVPAADRCGPRFPHREDGRILARDPVPTVAIPRHAVTGDSVPRTPAKESVMVRRAVEELWHPRPDAGESR